MAKKPPVKRKKPASLKPEAVLYARPKKTKVVATPKKNVTKPKQRKRKLHLAKYLHVRVRRRVFYPIVSIVLAFAVVLTWVIVQQSISDTLSSLQTANKRANDSYLIAKQEADLIKIIGTKLKRQSEIVNYQSAPSDLQAFVNADYRSFKTSCIANKQLSSDVGYEIANVVYDQYAVIRRTCNGTDTVILKKFGAKWAVVFSGNILPSCSLTNDLDIPQGAAYYCQQDGVQYVNPNP